jgi:hypothetical protein
MRSVFLTYILKKASGNHGNRACLPDRVPYREFGKMVTLAAYQSRKGWIYKSYFVYLWKYICTIIAFFLGYV